MYLLGYDIGSSSVKATVLDVQSGKCVASASSPEKEMHIDAKQAGWAEQDPDMWWENLKIATSRILHNSKISAGDIKAIGVSYQMHGLVVVDENKRVLRPALIWCDSRAVEIGNEAFEKIGADLCLGRLLNSPGNFTASKLKWVKSNEPAIYSKIHKAMLPGEYIAMRLTDKIVTTPSGLSEGILWDFQTKSVADIVLGQYGISSELLPEVVPTFSIQGEITSLAANELGLKAGTPISYRAGDQPNNALSLNVLNPGEIATTAGTSGVVYGIGASAKYDPQSRVNTFAHVNYSKESPRYGVLLCVNGTGILNSWLKHNIGSGMDYAEMNEIAAKAPIGSDGLVILPYGNGAERTLKNKNIGAQVHGLNFNIHGKSHVLRAGQEGIVFALNYGLDIMKGIGIEIKTIRAGWANMFLSPVFAKAFATVTNARIELFNTDGSQGAARGAGMGAGLYKNTAEAFGGLECKQTVEPETSSMAAYQEAYQRWAGVLNSQIKENK
ncbi:MAG: carbohydrate kinase [Planctomycetes bacterium GWF2_50_10]|nr:MAG: carbohydrate kinase [Planctomycetes bacterium GWF2_50_10]